MPFEDDHYTRGLYARSRRNVSSGNEAIYGIRAQLLFSRGYGNEQEKFIAFTLASLKKGIRAVYTPYVRVSYAGNLANPQLKTDYALYEDAYLNPHFAKENSRMEVKT